LGQNPHCRPPIYAWRPHGTVGDQIQQDADDFLREHFDHAGAGIELPLQRDIELGFSARAP
jgi:hypothetical protein